MKLTLGHGARPISTEVASGIAVVAAAIFISIAIVRQSILVLAAATAVTFAILLPVEMSLGVFAVLVPFDQVSVLGNTDVSITAIGGAFAGATLLLYGLVSGRFRAPTRAGLCWGLFVLWTVASLVWAIDLDTSLTRLPTVVTLFAVYIVAATFRATKQELSRILMLAVAGGAAVASFVIFEFAHHITFEGRGTLVVGSVVANANNLAINLLLPFSLALCGVLQGGSLRRRGALLAALVLLATCILLTMSRGGLVALVATLSVWLFRAGVRIRVLAPILILAIPLLFLPSLFYQRLEEATSLSAKTASGASGRGTGRYDIWLAGLHIVNSSPVIGVGLANFEIAYPRVAGYAHILAPGGYVRAPHDAYLAVCAETGVIGLALFITAIWVQMKEVRFALSTRDSYRYSVIALEAACWGQLVAAVSANIQWSKAFWLSFILLALVAHQSHESSNRPLGVPSLVLGRS
jgi:O-antigen ligase